jgi:PAS domain S-box-containing protein
MVLSNDITARKLAEEGLRRREDYLMALSELSRECLSLTDKRACCQAVVERIGPAARASRAYVFLDRRDAAGRLLASQIAEWCAGDASPEIDNPLLQNMSYEDLFPYGPDIFARGECMMVRVAEMTDVERALLEPEGIKAIMLVPILVNGRVLGFLGFDNCRDDKNWEANDQAFLRAAASSLGEALNRIDSESRLTRLMQAIKQAEEAIILTDTQGTIQFANPAFARMSGYGIPEIAGKNIEEFEQGEEREAIVQGIREILCAGGTWTRRSVNKRKDGTPYSEETTISPVRDAENKIIGHIAIRRDITREIELEEQLRQSQKMDAVGQLAGGVAHDFNNLLQAINGYTELALQSAADEHAVREYAQEVLKAGERAAGLVGQLLAFSRRQMMKPCHLDLNEVIGNLLKMLDRLIGEHIRLDFVPGHCLDAIHGDRGQIEQVLMNMCINARDAMPDGGRLTLETANVPFHDAHGRPSSPAPEGHGVSLKIADTGCGMDKATRERIFEPFFTTKAIGKGTGLGLATVYGIVRQHRGSIQVHSEPGEGAAFEIVFPASGEPATDSAPSVNVSDSRGIETILVAEDESIVRGFVGHVLERAGYKVLMASDGLEALRLFESNPGSIDLLLFDMIMPNLGGAAACERIRALRPGVRVLFASGYSPEATNIKNNVLAGQAMIQKPYTREELLRAVRQALEDRTA